MAALFCSQIICQKWGHVCCRGPYRGGRRERGRGRGGGGREGEKGRGRKRVREREKRDRKGRRERERKRTEIIKFNIKLPWKPFRDIITLTLLSMCTLNVWILPHNHIHMHLPALQ